MAPKTRNRNCQISAQRHKAETEHDCSLPRNPDETTSGDYCAPGTLRRRKCASLRAVLVVCLGLCLITLPMAQTEAGYASIVIDAQSGSVLHETNADTQNYPASLVKMMTLYLAFEALTGNRIRLDHQLVASAHAVSMAPSRLGLGRGQRIRAKEAILAIVTKSANDAAVVLSEGLGESEFKFVQMMNEKARELGMTRTVFRNATGLPNRRQVSTARDMATLARALLRDFPGYYHYFSVTEFHYGNHTYRNHNRLIESYAGADGIKTGYTRASGFNLAASVKRGGHRLIAVVLGVERQDRVISTWWSCSIALLLASMLHLPLQRSTSPLTAKHLRKVIRLYKPLHRWVVTRRR